MVSRHQWIFVVGELFRQTSSESNSEIYDVYPSESQPLLHLEKEYLNRLSSADLPHKGQLISYSAELLRTFFSVHLIISSTLALHIFTHLHLYTFTINISLYIHLYSIITTIPSAFLVQSFSTRILHTLYIPSFINNHSLSYSLIFNNNIAFYITLSKTMLVTLSFSTQQVLNIISHLLLYSLHSPISAST